jgi:uncharacterized protein (TIGR02271 family)
VTDYSGSNDRYSTMEENYTGYEMYSQDGESLGPITDIFLDENDQPEYFGVRTGSSESLLIPAEVTQKDTGGGRRIEVSRPASEIKSGPTFSSDADITPDLEQQIHSYYGLDGSAYESRGSYGNYYSEDEETSTATGSTTGATTSGTDEESGHVGPGIYEGDTETGEFRGHSEDNEGLNQRTGSDLEDQDELRVQRSEEELVAGTREREAGRVGIRKRVRTEREQISVPKRREEVHVDRVPVEGRTAPEAEIGEDEVVMPVTEEEVVVSKRPVVKEEVRVSTDVVEEQEVVEDEVRKEEVEVIDETDQGRTTTDPDDTTGRRGV